jgi:hypothetical protein
MAQSQAVEVLLRPAVELYTVAVCAGAALLCLVAPWSLALSPLLGLGSALAFLTFGAIRCARPGRSCATGATSVACHAT